MLWIGYESSEPDTKDDIIDIVNTVGELVYPVPVVAEDRNEHGFGLIVCDWTSDDWMRGLNTDNACQ